MDKKPILQVIDLTAHFESFEKRRVKAVDHVSFEVGKGDTLGIIGESGCGKSTLALSILQVLPPSARIVGGQIIFEGEDLLKKSPREMNRIRGEKIAMILQDPMMALNPVFTVGDQVGETLRYHRSLHGQVLTEKVKDLLLSVRIPEPERRIRQWPHEMSGGMRQRIVGAIALSCGPELIIADEPTTNLDVTIQLQYLDLLRDIQDKIGVTLIFITHNLGIVAQMCRSVLVMYAGKIVERAPVMEVYDHPAHPYTRMLLEAAFGLQGPRERKPIPGEPPDLANLPAGCSFHPRCPKADEICRIQEPSETLLSPSQSARCWLYGGK